MADRNGARGRSDDDDDVETSLHQAQELIGRAMLSRRRASRGVRHLPGDDAVFHSAIGDMIATARREVLYVHSTRDASAERRRRTLQLLQEADQRGVDVKALVPPHLVGTTAGTMRELGEQASYRTCEMPSQDLLIADGREAALRIPRRDEEPDGTLLVSIDPLVHVLRAMFGVTWSYGVPIAELRQIREKLRGQPARSILASLVAGDKDEVAARKLGISVRTYRRHVAEIMRGIRANSRFQAGARAAELALFTNPALQEVMD
ncbi:hypothetical protein [Micromonospora sp. NPDC050495]|uniref:hypothetical protein n=1 Tax=Micromonospora sp. NPDC050495 TaxID=3154936 RepID=UPI0033F7BF95